MGIPTPPDDVGDGDEVNACFTKGVEPNGVWISFFGVQKGNFWLASDGEPLEGTYFLPWVSENFFRLNDGNVFIEWGTVETLHTIRAYRAGGRHQFSVWPPIPPGCLFGDANTSQTASSVFYGGRWWVTCESDGDGSISLTELNELHPDVADGTNYAEPQIYHEDYNITRLVQNRDGTNFKLRKVF